MEKEIVVSGSRPTGDLHLGNYIGAVKNYVQMQEDEKYEGYFFIADYHSLTTHLGQEDLRVSVRSVLANYLAAGLDPDKCTIYAQSDMPQIPELYLILNMMSYKGELEKTPTFKEKVRMKGQTINAGLLTYPVLMTADIIIHRAHKVPVGKDQEQHLEMARNIAGRFNHTFNTEFFPEPQAFSYGENLIKVPGLEGTGKMSKSGNGNNAIFFTDSKDVLKKKVMKAKTDSGPTEKNSEKPEMIKNLFDLMKLVSADDVVAQFDADYNSCSIRYGDMKKKLAEDMEIYMKPLRDKTLDLKAHPEKLDKILRDGAEKARASASATLNGVRDIIGLGFVPFK